jgi:hypothetical protein
MRSPRGVCGTQNAPDGRHAPAGAQLTIKLTWQTHHSMVPGQVEVKVMRQSMLLKFHLIWLLLMCGVRYIRTQFKNAMNIGSKQRLRRDPSDVFFQDYVKYLLGLQPGPKITSRGWDDGVGCQARLIMCAINFARVCGLPYVHTPFSKIEHADRSMESWVNAWEQEFNLGAGEILANDCQCIDFSRIFYRFGFLDSAFNVTADEFRTKYYLNKEPRINPKLTIAIHVRRGDLLKGKPHWTELRNVATTIRQIKAILTKNDIQYRMQVFSEGVPSEFRELEHLDIELFLNSDTLWTLRELIEADIFVMAKSSFSYVAALISDGIKIYEPWPKSLTGTQVGYRPLKNWLVRLPEGNFDERYFMIQLKAMTQFVSAQP